MAVTGQTMEAIQGLSGEGDLPGNPEISLMALALAAKAEGVSEICRCSRRPDVDALVDALTRFGLAVERGEEGVRVTGGELQALEGPLDAGRSEVLFACLTGLLADAPFQSQLDGNAACAARIEPVLEALGALDAPIFTPAEGIFPLKVGGRALKPGRHQGGVPSTAVKCAVFLAGLGIEGAVELIQEAPGDEDLEVLFRAAGAALEKGRVEGGMGHRIALEGPVRVQPACHNVPGDPTAALFLLLTAAMLKGSELTLNGMGNNWKARRMLDLLRRLNVQLEVQVTRSASGFSTRRVRVVSSELRPIKISDPQAALFLNELPFLAVVGACAGGETIIRDAQALRQGKTDCIALVVENLRKMQAHVGEIPDGLVVQGGLRLQGAEVDAGGDSRIAMAFTLAGLVAEGETTVLNRGQMDRDFFGVMEALLSVAQIT